MEGKSRIPLPLRYKTAEADDDSDSEIDYPRVKRMVENFKIMAVRNKEGGSFGESFISLPSLNLSSLEGRFSSEKLSCQLETGLKKKSYLVEENGLVALKMEAKVKEKAEKGAELAEYKQHVGKRKQKKLRREEREKTKGKDWYNMPALELNEERKRDLELLQMRGVLDPKRFYKKNSVDTIPKYFQVSINFEFGLFFVSTLIFAA